MGDGRLSSLDQTAAAARTYQEAQRRAFRPAESMEALALQVMGGWENLLAEVNWSRFHAASYGAGRLDQERLAKAMRDLADAARVRWPHREWAEAAVKAKFARDMLVHLLFIVSIDGERPDRVMNVMMLGQPWKPRRGVDGNPGELSWRDEIWSSQKRHIAPLSEQALIEALAGIEWMLACCRGLNRLRDILGNDTADLPDDKVIDPFAWQVNWWLPEWGSADSVPITVGMVRLLPGEQNSTD